MTSKKILKYENDCWEGIYIRTKRDAIGEFIIQLATYLPRGINHDSYFNKIRKYLCLAAGVKIGMRSFVYPGVTMICPGNIEIGNDSFLNYNCLLSAYEKIKIGNRVSISYNVSIITETHNPNSKDFSAVIKPVEIEDDVWIGANCTVLPGVKIQRGAVIAANSVVTKDVKEFSIVAGNPAKFLKERIIDE